MYIYLSSIDRKYMNCLMFIFFSNNYWAQWIGRDDAVVSVVNLRLDEDGEDLIMIMIIIMILMIMMERTGLVTFMMALHAVESTLAESCIRFPQLRDSGTS